MVFTDLILQALSPVGAAMTVNLPFLATNLERDTQNYTANNQN